MEDKTVKLKEIGNMMKETKTRAIDDELLSIAILAEKWGKAIKQKAVSDMSEGRLKLDKFHLISSHRAVSTATFKDAIGLGADVGKIYDQKMSFKALKEVIGDDRYEEALEDLKSSEKISYTLENRLKLS